MEAAFAPYLIEITSRCDAFTCSTSSQIVSRAEGLTSRTKPHSVRSSDTMDTRKYTAYLGLRLPVNREIVIEFRQSANRDFTAICGWV